MAVASLLGSVTWNTTAGSKTVTATPAVGDQIFLVTAHSGFTTTTTAPTDNNPDGLGAYTIVASALKNTSADLVQIWRRNSLVGNASSTVFTHAPATTTGGGLGVIKVTGIPTAGSAVVIQSGTQANASSGTTPTVTLGHVASPSSVMIGAVFSTTNGASATQRTGYTEQFDAGYNTPASGLEIITLNSGETGSSIAWGGTTASAYGAIVVEINAPAVGAAAGTGSASSVGQSVAVAAGSASGTGAAAGQPPALTTFDPTKIGDAGVFASLSNGNLTATGINGTAGDYGNVGATSSKSSGKVTYSFTFDSCVTGADTAFGFGDASFTWAGITQFTGSAHTMAWRVYGDGTSAGTFYNGSTFVDLTTINGGGWSGAVGGAGHEHQILIDIDNLLVYLAIDGSPVFGMNPAAGTGGISIAISAPFTPGLSHGDANVATLKPTPTYVPGAFSPWDAATSSGSVGAASGTGAATGVGRSLATGVGAASGTGAASGVGSSQASGAGAAAGIGAASSRPIVSGAASGSGSATGVGASNASAVASAAGIGAASAVGASLAASVGAASGTGAASGVGRSIAAAIGAAAGTGAASGTGSSLAAATGSAAGVGSAAAIPLTGASAGSASGTGAATGVGSSLAKGVGSASGVGAASGVSLTSASVGAASGTGSATATGSSLSKAAGASSGVGAASGAGTALASAVGASAGLGAANANGTGVVSGSGSASGSSSASATGKAYFTGVGLSAGFGVAVGVGQSIALADGLSAGASSADAGGIAFNPGAKTYPLAGIAQAYPGTAAAYPITTAQPYPQSSAQTYPLEGEAQQYPLAS